MGRCEVSLMFMFMCVPVCIGPGCSGTEGDVLSPVLTREMVRPPDMLHVLDLGQPPMRECVTDVLGDNTTCMTEAEWKKRGFDTCTTRGLIVENFTLVEACDVGMFRFVKLQCCPMRPIPKCHEERQGGETSCKDPAMWKNHAALSCKAMGMVVRELQFLDLCGPDAYRQVRYLCCPEGAALR